VPRRIIQHPSHSRRNALWIAVWWIETFTVHGPGAIVGEPTVLVDEYADFVIDCYALDEDGKRLYDSGFFSRPKGCDKSGLASKVALYEALGPCRFAGYAVGGETYEFLGQVYTYSPGEPMGKSITTPYVRIMATEEGQTGNVYDTIYHNLSDENAPLSALRMYGCDPGLTRIILPYGGEITPSTAGASSKDGGKETFVVFDETHLYNTPQLHLMYSTVTRNLLKRKREGTWFIETTTMYAPGQESVAEETYRYADLIEEGKAKRAKLFFDHRWGTITDLGDEEQLQTAIQEAYGDALLWNDLEGIIDGILDPRAAENDSRRYFLNALTAARNAWVDPEVLEHASEAARAPEFRPLSPGDTITLGFDGSKNSDATALIACRVEDRYLFPIHIEEQPDGPEAEGWTVNREAFDAAVANSFKRYDVVGFYGDPPHWQDYIDMWAREYKDDLAVHASGAHSVEWWTNRDVPMALALERLHDALVDKSMVFPDMRHPLTPDVAILHRHFLNARTWPRRAGNVIGKDRKGSVRKIDAAMAATLAFEAAADYAAKGRRKPNMFVPIRVR
jgi:hypothetical protein